VHTETDSATANVLDLNNWEFLVMATERLNDIFGDQKSVALSVIRKHCDPTNLKGLKATIDACLADP
jgi:hypothetical protein